MQASIRKPTTADLSLLILLALIWASAFLAIKVVVVDTGPLWLATIRVVVAFIVLLPFAIYKGFVWPSTIREWKLVMLVMALNVVIPFFLISWAETKIDAGMASMLMGVGPFMALLGSHFTTQDDRISTNKLIGAILGFSGILVLVGWDAARGLGDNLLGQGAAILGSACYVTSGLIIRRLGRFPPIQLSAFILGLASISLLTITILFEGIPKASYQQDTWMGLIYLGIFPTALGYILRYHLIQTIGMSAFATGLNLIPVFGVMLGAIFLDEQLTLNVLVSLTLIVTGLFIIRRG
ncbi:DMT family transporter [uncultured Cocleimonas sp.]|uniref:DMT family transporter n=1 Tax=uncultured Cocleimonas sp. TaxID=1051587 RepID=UPI00260C2D18|nr:DMT family transporter [uncultured Cocleimonas sp.]